MLNLLCRACILPCRFILKEQTRRGLYFTKERTYTYMHVRANVLLTLVQYT